MNPRSRRILHRWQGVVLLIALVAVPLVGGCSRGGLPGLQPVTGTVTYQGKPVDGALISFVSEGQTRAATAVSQADGSFELYTLETPGAEPGKYIVVVTKVETPAGSNEPDPGFNEQGVDLSMLQAAQSAGKPQPKPAELLPVKYSNPETSPLRFEVKDASGNVCELKLE